MAAPAHFGDIFRAPDLVQSGGNMVVEPENKFILLMTNPATAQGRLGNARANPFESAFYGHGNFTWAGCGYNKSSGCANDGQYNHSRSPHGK